MLIFTYVDAEQKRLISKNQCS